MTARAEDEVRRAREEARRAHALDGFAANVLAFRRIARLSQEEAAVRAGLHRTEISLLERAGRVPRLDTVVRVAAGVEAEPADLLEGLAWEIDLERWPRERPCASAPTGSSRAAERSGSPVAGRGSDVDRSLSRRFGLLLALHRMRAGLSQEECGRVVGLHRTELSLLERGGRTPRLDTLLALAAAIEAPPRELVTGMQWSPGVVEAGGEYVVEGIDA